MVPNMNEAPSLPQQRNQLENLSRQRFMCRTAVNVTGDLVGCVTIDRSLAEPW